MKLKHLIVGAGITAFSLLALAVPEATTSRAGSAAATSAPVASKPATKAKIAKQKNGKTRGLKSKKRKECDSDNGCQAGGRT